MWDFRAQLERVVDGDTITLLCDTAFFGRHSVDIRLKDVNSPDDIAHVDRAAAAFIESWMDRNIEATRRWGLYVVTETTKVFEPTQKRSFTRYIGNVWTYHGDTWTFKGDVSVPEPQLGRWLNEELRQYLAGIM